MPTAAYLDYVEALLKLQRLECAGVKGATYGAVLDTMNGPQEAMTAEERVASVHIREMLRNPIARVVDRRK